MKTSLRLILLMFVGMIACSGHKIAQAQTLSIPHPDEPVKKVEYFLQKPKGNGPWPTVVFLHGHQDWPRAGGKDFVQWGVLDQFADHGYLAVAVSQPGYGNSTGPADFCGPFTQHAVAAVIAKLRAARIRQGQQNPDSGCQSRRFGGRNGSGPRSLDSRDYFDLRLVRLAGVCAPPQIGDGSLNCRFYEDGNRRHRGSFEGAFTALSCSGRQSDSSDS